MNNPKIFRQIGIIIIALFVTVIPLSASASTDIKKIFKRSYQLERQGNYHKAIKTLSKLHKGNPGDYKINLRLGWLYYRSHSFSRSITYYKKAIKAFPTASEPKLGYSLPLIAQDKWEEAETTLSEIVKRDHYSFYGNLKLSYVLRAQDKHTAAEKISRKMLKLYPDNTSFMTELALAKKGEGDTKTANKIFKEILILKKDNPSEYNTNLRLGWHYYKSNAFKNSIAHYKKAVKASPLAIDAKLGHSLPLIAQDEWAEAERVLYKIIKKDHYSFYGNLRLSYVLRGQEKYTLAEKISRKMLELYPSNTSFMTELALAKKGAGKTEEANKLFEEILILSPENTKARQCLMN